jgi:hypothetical protein
MCGIVCQQMVEVFKNLLPFKTPSYSATNQTDSNLVLPVFAFPGKFLIFHGGRGRAWTRGSADPRAGCSYWQC